VAEGEVIYDNSQNLALLPFDDQGESATDWTCQGDAIGMLGYTLVPDDVQPIDTGEDPITPWVYYGCKTIEVQAGVDRPDPENPGQWIEMATDVTRLVSQPHTSDGPYCE